MQRLEYHNNFIYEIVKNDDINIIKNKLKKLYNFKYLFYCLKYKNKFRNWLWIKIREPKIKKQYHPNNLLILLNEIDDNNYEEKMDSLLNNW